MKRENLKKVQIVETWHAASLADPRCTECLGNGAAAPGKECPCIYPKVFKECCDRYHTERSKQISGQTTVTEQIRGVICARISEDYMVDFEKVAYRWIDQGTSPLLRMIFKNIYLSGLYQDEEDADKRPNVLREENAIARRLGVTQTFVAEQRKVMIHGLGFAMYTVRPHAIYPHSNSLRGYFGAPLARKRGDWRKK